MGRIEIRRGGPADLYDLSLTYCADHFRARSHFDEGGPPGGEAGPRLLTVAALPREGKFRGLVGSREPNRLSLRFPPGIPLELRLATGGETDLDLTVLTVTRLVLHAGSGETRVRFQGGNPRDMELFRLVAGSGPVRLEGLGWGRVTSLELHGGSGDAVVDWTGPGPVESAALLDPGTGAISMVFPADLGVDLSGKGPSPNDCAPEFSPVGAVCRSRNFEQAPRHLSVILDRGEGPLDFRWKR